MEEFLQILSVRRHDLLNHLQVISGYLQLNKPERAREYINHIQADITEESRLCGYRPAAVAVALLYLRSQALLNGINLPLKVDKEIGGSQVPIEILVELIKVYSLFVKEIAGQGLGDVDSWALEIRRVEQSFLWNFRIPAGKNLGQKLAERMRLILEQVPNCTGWTLQVVEGQVVLQIPRV